jgi:lipoteichoic acid synthase
MRHYSTNFFYVFKWECFQFFLFLIYLLLFYIHEMNAAHFLGQDNPQVVSIHLFLNSLQLAFLPDFFFFLFLPIILISISLIVFKKGRWVFLALCGMLISILLVADNKYYLYFSTLITTQSFSAAGQIWDVRSAIFESITFSDLLSVVCFIIFVFFGILINRKITMGLPEGKIAFTIEKIMGILFFLLAIYTYNIAFYIPKRYVMIGTDNVMRVSKTKIHDKNTMHYIPNYQASNYFYASTFGLMNFHIKNLTDTCKDYFIQKNIKNLPSPQGIYSFFNRKKKINEISSPFYGIANGRNVFLIHFESLNPILMGLVIDGAAITPTLNQLEKTGLYWCYLLDQVTIGGSSDAEFSVLTGMFPSTERISAFNASCMPHIPSLPRKLKSMGYQTISLHGYESSFWNRNTTQPLLGFETMYFKKSFQYEKNMGLGISDKEFFSQSIDLIKKHSPPIFAFLMTLTSHVPYTGIPEDYQNLFRHNFEKDSILINYLSAIRYTDDALGDFFLKVKMAGLWENSIFIIYGDHRPGGSTEKMISELIKVSGNSLKSPRFSCVPALILIPGYENLILENKNQYDNVIGGLYDIFPTIMHLLGENTPFGVYGSHLFVKNTQRDPVPFLRFGDSFVFNSIHYLLQGKEISKDNIGLIFTNDIHSVLNSESEKLTLYKNALQTIYYCNYIYDSNCDLGALKPDN